MALPLITYLDTARTEGELKTSFFGPILDEIDLKLVDPMTTEGDIIYANASIAASRLGIGTEGQVLTSSSGVPAWSTPSGGSWEFVSSATASTSTSVDFTGLVEGYDYRVIIRSLVPTTGTDELYLVYGTGATPTYQTTSYDYRAYTASFGGTSTFGGGSTAQIAISDAIGATAGKNLYGEILVYNPGNASDVTRATFNTIYTDRMTYANGGCSRDAVEAVTALRFFCSTSTIASGDFELWRRTNN